VTALLASAGLPTDDEAVKRMAAESISELLRAQMAARAAGEDPGAIDRDRLLRDVVNRTLAASGQEALPEPTVSPSPAAVGSPSPGPTGSPAPATPSATETTPQPPTPTPVPPTATPVPPTPIPVPPTPTPIPPTPTPTPTPTVETRLPVVVASGGFTDGNGFATTFSITFDFKTGAVSGSVKGQRASEVGAPCTSPSGQVLDWSKGIVTETWQTGLSGGVSAEGGFSASFAGSVTTAFTLTEPFDEPGGCVGRDPAYPVPGPSPVSGILTGTATTSGAISLTSSLGGSWSGTGSVQ
jgi:hypothetical protein